MYKNIAEGIYLVGGGGYTGSSDCLVYALDLGDAVLVDCGCGPGWERLGANMSEAGIDPAHLHTLMLTHMHVDHIGAAPAVARDTGCRVVAHELDADHIETGDSRRTAAGWYGMRLEPMQVTHRLERKGGVLEFSEGKLHYLHTPGHTPGSIVCWVDTPDVGRVLFGQDIHGPFSPDFDSDIDQWRQSMGAVLDLNADILCEGHYGIYEGKDKVRSFIEEQLRSH